jgi:hypothetical protein
MRTKKAPKSTELNKQKNSNIYETKSKPMSKEGRNRCFGQGSLDAFLEERQKRKRTGKDRTGKQEGEEEGVFKPDNQAEFRKGRGTMDNEYILDHLTKYELKKKGGRMYALFVDFRATFDKVDREKCLHA